MQGSMFRLQSLLISLAVVVLGASQAMVAEGRERGEGRETEVIRGPMGNVAVEGPRGNVAVGTRFNVLPSSANTVFVGGQTYSVDGDGIYYLPCDDDNTVYCVVPAPQND